MNRSLAALGLGTLWGLAWWTPHVSLAAIPVSLGLADPGAPEAPAVWVGGACVAVAVAVAAAPWLSLVRPSEEQILLAVFCGLALSGVRRAWDRTVVFAALASGALGAAVLGGGLPGGWIAGLPGAVLTALGVVVPGLPWRLAAPDAVGLAVVAGGAAAGAAAWWRFGDRARGVWSGLALGSALAAMPFQGAAPPRLDGWHLGHRTRAADVGDADPRGWPREITRPTFSGAVGAAAGIALGAALGARRRGGDYSR